MFIRNGGKKYEMVEKIYEMKGKILIQEICDSIF